MKRMNPREAMTAWKQRPGKRRGVKQGSGAPGLPPRPAGLVVAGGPQVEGTAVMTRACRHGQPPHNPSLHTGYINLVITMETGDTKY